MQYGHIKLFRRIQKHKLWKEKPFTRGQAWIDMLMMANYQTGILEHSQRFYAARWGWSRQRVRSFQKYLQNEGMITTHPTTHLTTQIKIQNYKKFHDKQPTQQPTQQPKDKNIKNINTKDIYAELKNVRLTKEEYSKLVHKFGEPKTIDYIERLSEYLASKGKKYKSHYATILSWSRKDDKEKPSGRSYVWIRCSHCGQEDNRVKKGKPCPNCEKIV